MMPIELKLTWWNKPPASEVLGTQHSSELNHPLAVPDIALATARALADFTAHDGPQPVRMAMPPSPGEGAEHAKL